MIYNWNSFVLNYYKSSLDLQYFGPVETNLIKCVAGEIRMENMTKICDEVNSNMREIICSDERGRQHDVRSKRKIIKYKEKEETL